MCKILKDTSRNAKSIVFASFCLICFMPYASAEEKSNASDINPTNWQITDGTATSSSRNIEDVLAGARSGDAKSQFEIGMMYYNGDVVPKNYIIASAWFLRAAEQRYGDAQGQLGLMYMMGQGVEENYAYAYKWIGLASRKDNYWSYYRNVLEKRMGSTENLNLAQGIVANADRQLSSAKAPSSAKQDKALWRAGTIDGTVETTSSSKRTSGVPQEPYFGATTQEWQDECRDQGGAIKGSKVGFCVMGANPSP